MHVCVLVCGRPYFPSWPALPPELIHGTHPIRHSACATRVFLFILLVFSSSATTRTLPGILFPARDKPITDVKEEEEERGGGGGGGGYRELSHIAEVEPKHVHGIYLGNIFSVSVVLSFHKPSRRKDPLPLPPYF